MTICSQEKLKITPKEIDEIIELSGKIATFFLKENSFDLISDCDVRQTIYNLQLRAASGNDAVKGGAKKNVAIVSVIFREKWTCSILFYFQSHENFTNCIGISEFLNFW